MLHTIFNIALCTNNSQKMLDYMYCNLKKQIKFVSLHLVSVIEQQRSISIKFNPFDITELCIIWKFKQLSGRFISGLWLAIQGPES